MSYPRPCRGCGTEIILVIKNPTGGLAEPDHVEADCLALRLGEAEKALATISFASLPDTRYRACDGIVEAVQLAAKIAERERAAWAYGPTGLAGGDDDGARVVENRTLCQHGKYPDSCSICGVESRDSFDMIAELKKRLSE